MPSPRRRKIVLLWVELIVEEVAQTSEQKLLLPKFEAKAIGTTIEPRK